MNLRLLLLLCFLFVGSLMNGQDCPLGDLIFTNQAEIDDFLFLYPNCTEIAGSVNIEESGTNFITNLSALQNITAIGGDLKIYDNDNLTNLVGLENLTNVNGNLIIINSSLTNLAELNNLTTIEGDLRIRYLSNLTGLDNLLTIGGDLNIYICSYLTNLEGLNNLTTIGGALLIDFTGLTNLEGLNNLTTIGSGYSRISNSLNLINLEGLNNLTSIEGTLEIQDNASLTSLSGLNNLTSITSLYIGINANLTTLSGLNNLTTINNDLSIAWNDNLIDISALNNLTINDHLSIHDNPVLDFCSILSVCNHIGNEGSTSIYENTLNCNSLYEVELNCILTGAGIFHPIFYDLNENGSLEEGEPFYQNASVSINPGNIVSYGNSINGGLNYKEFGNYVVSYNILNTPNWELTTNSSYDITLSESNPQDTVFFGVKPTTIYSDAVSTMVSGNLRCNTSQILNIYGENTGTTLIDGTIWLSIAPNITGVEYIDSPDTLIPPNLYGWHFNELFPGTLTHKKIQLEIPGPPDFPLGAALQFQSYLTYTDGNDDYTSNTFEYSDIVECSYDPNDKLVNPVYPLNYALIGEPLTYTIRFQNTGNAEAYDVVIRDTLDTYLNPATFRVIASSHDAVLNTELENNQFLSFNFIDINLPDSTSNLEESQGFVMYSIQAYENIIDGTEITNTASIYFDLNPPIVTNTTQNIMLHSFDADEDGSDIFVDCDDQNATIYPGAEEIVNNGIDEDCDGSDLTSSIQVLGNANVNIFPNPTRGFIQIEMSSNIAYQVELLDLTGKTLLTGNNLSVINLSLYPAAVYLLQITDLDTKSRIMEKVVVTR